MEHKSMCMSSIVVACSKASETWCPVQTWLVVFPEPCRLEPLSLQAAAPDFYAGKGKDWAGAGLHKYGL